MSKQTKNKEKSALSELMRYAGNRKYLTYASWVLSAASAVIALLPFVCIFRIIQEVIAVAPDFSQAVNLVHNGVWAVIFALVSMLLYFCALMCSHLSAFRVAVNIRKTLMEHITKLPIGYVDEQGSGKLRRIVNDSSAATETYLAHQLPDAATVVVTLIALILVLFLFDWRYGLVSLIPVVLSMIAMSRTMGPALAEDMKKYQGALEDMNRESVEYVRGMSVVKTFSQTVYSFSRFKHSIDTYYKFCINYTKSCRSPMIYFQMAINSTFAFLIVLTLILCQGGNALSDVALNFIFYVIFTPIIATSFTRIMYMGEESMTVKDAIRRFDSILSAQPLDETKQPKTPKDDTVVFDDVTFRYQKDAKLAVQNLSFTIPAGHTAAFVGPSGSGKSTMAGLISRFWDVESGAVRIGGVDVREMSKQSRVNTVSYVFQNSKLLKMTIAENVRLARPDASDEEVLAALHDAQCDEILEKLPNGIHTMIGTQGTYLSGGEQQRIAIARAILQNAPILVLDEATAFADPENEALMQKAFEKLAKNKTVLMIAHRLTTIQHADCIYVMDHGNIVEHGTHTQLLEKQGLYREMWDQYQHAAQWKVGDNK